MKLTKVCSRCGIEKSLADFVKDDKCKDGRKNPCESCRKEYRKNYYRLNSLAARDRGEDYRAANKEEIKAKKSKYREENREKLREKQRDYYNEDKLKNPERWSDKERKEILKRQTLELTREQRREITYFYSLRDALTFSTGTAHHVDHIIPLKGKNFSGLHVPWNLQVITAEENLQKGNRLCIDEMWDESDLM